MSTTLSHIKLNLEQGLKTAGISIAEANSQVAMRNKLIKWLDGWISKGAPGTVSQRIDAARAMFNAKQDGISDVVAGLMIDHLDKLKNSFETLFSTMPESSRSVLAVIPHNNLQYIETSLGNLIGKADSGDDPKQMNMLMHSLIEEATKHAGQHEVNQQGQEFTKKLRELVNENIHSFTEGFLNDFKASLKERQAEAPIDASLYDRGNKLNPANHLDQAMNLLLQTKDNDPLIDLGLRNINSDYEAWSKLSPEARAEARKEAVKFFANIKNSAIEEMDAKTKAATIQEQFKSIKNKDAKLLVRIKVQEEKTRLSLIKHEQDFAKIFGNLFGEGFGSQALATVLLGFAGGSLFGMPGLGICFTGLITILGALKSPETGLKTPPEKK